MKPGQLSHLVFRYLTRKATPGEKMKLEEWASLSTENRVWLDRFKNIEWLESSVKSYREPDLEECEKEFLKGIDLRKIKTAKRKKMVRRLLWCVLFLSIVTAIFITLLNE